MFGLGMPEILLILAIALIVIGPKKLPDLAKTLGRAMGEFKRSAQDFKASIDIDTTVNDLTDLEPTDSKLKEALKSANEKATEPDSEDAGFTRNTHNSEQDIEDENSDPPFAEKQSDINSNNDSFQKEANEPATPEKDDSIKHE